MPSGTEPTSPVMAAAAGSERKDSLTGEPTLLNRTVSIQNFFCQQLNIFARNKLKKKESFFFGKFNLIHLDHY